MLVDGMGGINPDGIRLVLEIEQIEQVELITQKLIIYMRTALYAQNKEHTDGGKDSKN